MKTTVYLIQCVPQIWYLKLRIEPNAAPELADPIFWETLLSPYLVKLKRLSLKAFVFDKSVSANPIWNFLTDKQELFKRIKVSNYCLPVDGIQDLIAVYRELNIIGLHLKL